jgi:selenocysteine lyase/cysteine desulfurase
MDKNKRNGSTVISELSDHTNGNQSNGSSVSISELEKAVCNALKTYSNVHRGSSLYSVITTHLFEQARKIILEYMGLERGRYFLIFCTLRRENALKDLLVPGSFKSISADDIGLSLGVRAIAVLRKALPGGIPFQTGGGTARLVAPGWVIWAGAPDKFEAGTPSVINIIAFAKALQLIKRYGDDTFKDITAQKLTASEILLNDDLEKYSGGQLLDEFKLRLIGRGECVPTAEGTKPYINLDNGASTPSFKPIWEAVFNTWLQPEQVQKEVLLEVKSICARFLGAPQESYDIIYTSNATEAINLVAESLKRESEPSSENVLLSTLLEHSSNDLPWRNVPGLSMIRLSVDSEGFVDLDELESLLSEYNEKGQYGKKRITMVSVSGASNVLGVFNDLAEIGRIVHRYGARFLVDAAQLVAHRKVAIEESGIDFLAFSAHKVYAPFGCGVLVAKKELLKFSSDEMKLIQSSGEENPGGIAALGKALVILQRIGMDIIQEEEQVLTRRTLSGLSKVAGIRIFGITDLNSPQLARKGGVIVFSMNGIMPDKLARELSWLGGIGVRYGCHCAHILIKHLLGVPPALARFQAIIVTLFPKLRLPGLVRVSLGIENSAEDVDRLIEVLGRIAGRSGSVKDLESSTSLEGIPLITRADVQKQIYDFTISSSSKVFFTSDN